MKIVKPTGAFAKLIEQAQNPFQMLRVGLIVPECF
jgi:hypothetical protein